jgi:hypothetical protein
MATVYANGFEWNSFYENILSWGGGNSSSGTMITNSLPLSGNYCLHIARSTGANFLRWQTVALNEFYIQVGFKLERAPSINYDHDGYILKWQSGVNVVGILSFNPDDQKLSVYVGDHAAFAGSSTVSLLYERWYYIELYIHLDATTGFIELKVDGLPQFIFEGASTPSYTTVDMFHLVGDGFDSSSSGCSFWVDDIVINDTTGSVNNSWPNGAKIVLLLPSGRGFSSQWDKTAYLDNYENVDKLPTLDPDGYLYTNITDQLDLYLLEDLPADAFSVASARIDAWALKNSGSDIMLKMVLRTDGTNYSSDVNELGVSYALVQWLHQINPKTGINWTVADLNDLQSGMESNIPD